MGNLNFREVTKDNFYEIIKLSRTLPEVQRMCVAPNVVSIAEGSVHSHAYYRGIYLDDTPIGFFMLSIPNEETKGTKEDNGFYLWRFMIAYDFQKKHYGKETLDHIVKMGIELGYKELITSCHTGVGSPYDFYLKYGFIDTGEVDDGEEVLKLTFSNIN